MQLLKVTRGLQVDCRWEGIKNISAQLGSATAEGFNKLWSYKYR